MTSIELLAIGNAQNGMRSDRDQLRKQLQGDGLVIAAESATYSGGFKAIKGASTVATPEQREVLAAWRKLAADYNATERVGAAVIKALRKAEAKATKAA